MEKVIINKEEIQEKLVDFLCRQFLVDEEDIELDKSLVDTGIIDSMGLIEIASYIKTTYGYTVSNNQMNRENFGSVYKLVDFINNLNQE